MPESKYENLRQLGLGCTGSSVGPMGEPESREYILRFSRPEPTARQRLNQQRGIVKLWLFNGWIDRAEYKQHLAEIDEKERELNEDD